LHQARWLTSRLAAHCTALGRARALPLLRGKHPCVPSCSFAQLARQLAGLLRARLKPQLLTWLLT
jgi:hypothetical protein